MDSRRKECAACGLLGSKNTWIHTTNGVLSLCGQCFADINRKNPELKALRTERDELARKVEGLEGKVYE